LAEAQQAAQAGMVNPQDVQNLQELAAGLKALADQAAASLRGLKAQEQAKVRRQLLPLDETVKAALMPFVLGFDQANTRQQFADFGQDFEQKSAVVTAGYTLENMTTATGAAVQVPVPRVLELTSRRPVAAGEWQAKVQAKEAKAAGYYQSQLAAAKASQPSGAISGALSRVLSSVASPFGQTFVGRALNSLALDLNHGAYMQGQAKTGQYRSEAMKSILADQGSGLQTLIQRRNLTRAQFQKQMLTALIRVLDANPQDVALLQDVVDMMNRVAPSSGVAAGKIMDKAFSLPNILEGAGMHGRLGKILEIMRGFPQDVVLNDNVENLIKRQVMRSAAQAA
jgi:hypothetical protein